MKFFFFLLNANQHQHTQQNIIIITFNLRTRARYRLLYCLYHDDVSYWTELTEKLRVCLRRELYGEAFFVWEIWEHQKHMCCRTLLLIFVYNFYTRMHAVSYDMLVYELLGKKKRIIICLTQIMFIRLEDGRRVHKWRLVKLMSIFLKDVFRTLIIVERK